MKQAVITLLFILFSSIILIAQDNFLKNGQIRMKNGTKIIFKKAQYSESEIKINTSESVLLLKDIEYIRHELGTNAKGGAQYGFLTGAAFSLYAFLSVSTNRNQRLKDNWFLTLAGITGGCTLVGLAIGSSSKKMKTIYEPLEYYKRKKTLTISANPLSGASLVYSF